MKEKLEKIIFKTFEAENIPECSKYLGAVFVTGGYFLQNPELMVTGMALYQSP